MELTAEQRVGLGVALEEADLIGLEIDPDRRIAGATLRVLSLPMDGPPPDDSRVAMRFSPVGRVAASLREAPWDDRTAPAVPFAVGDVLTVVQGFNGLPIYGWEFLDVHDRELAKWGNRLSLDWESGDDGRSHSLMLFQDAGNRVLDVIVWFDQLEIYDPAGAVIPLDRFIADGRRWWDALYAGDPRTSGSGIFPLR